MITDFNRNALMERMAVIDNIARAVADRESFRKVELGDPIITADDIKRVILPFDNLRKKPISKAKAFIARRLAEKLTVKVNKDTVIVGLENALNISGGSIITSNHYNPTDSTPIRMLARLLGKRKKHNIIVQQSNVFMTGLFGFLMRNCGTLPVSDSAEYMTKNLKPAIETLLCRGHLILIYPEQEMWYNYKKPRACRDGAYHYAAAFGVPIIPTFTQMQNIDGEYDENGFMKVKHILHVMPAIYPDPELSIRENRRNMQMRDIQCKTEAYERAYGIDLTDDFDPYRDIAGYHSGLSDLLKG